MFRVLRSSAGAGKTHSLVKHYLELCLRSDDPAAYRRVLALTFTNKAAAEMKERVLGYLERLARMELDDAAIRDAAAHLMAATGANERGIAERANATLEHMLHHWGDAAISTIDAFTRRVVRPFSRELRLQHDLRMTTEEEWYRERALEAVLAKAGTDERITEMLTATAMQLLEDEEPWDPGKPIRRLGRQLTMEHAIAALETMRGMESSALRSTIDRLRAENIAYRERIRKLGAEALQSIRSNDLQAGDLSRGKTGYYNFLHKLAVFEADWLEPNSYVASTLEKDDWCSRSIAVDAKLRLERIAPVLRGALESAVEILAEGQAAYFVRDAVLRELPAAFTLAELSRSLEERKQEDGVAFFSDLTRLVADLVKEEPAHYIHERLGERYEHYLIDEFQDTSLLQWSTLLPLVANALASGGTALLVGDAKQAIYRWRNGEARLFQGLPRLFGIAQDTHGREYEKALQRHHVPIAPLADNHRSAPEIIAFNNALFEQLKNKLAPDLLAVYENHQQRPFKNGEGLVHLERTDKAITGEAAAERREAFVLRCVSEALDDGFAPGDIAVLVRSNKVGQAVADILVSAGHRVTSPDGLLLGGDTLTEALIDLLRVIQHDDALAAARAWQRLAQLKAGSEETVDAYADIAPPAEPLALIRTWLSDHHLALPSGTLTALISDMLRAIGVDPASDARALAFLHEAHAFATAHGPSLPAFVEHWDREGHRRSLSPPPDRDAIQVLTIHKAKGLEFPVVIMPSTRMASHERDHLWVSSTQQYTGLGHALVKPSARLDKAALPELSEEQALAFMDALDLLYVAFTRPVQRLYALASASKPDAVTQGLLEWMDAHGSEDAWTKGTRTGPWKEAAPSNAELLAPQAVGALPYRLAMKQDAPEEWDARDPSPMRRKGEIAHSVLSQVLTIDDLPAAVTRAREEGLLDAAEAKSMHTELLMLLNRPDLAPWFANGSDTRIESALIGHDGRTLRPDRVLIKDGSAYVLDYKSGGESDTHHVQVRGYMELLQAMGYARVEGSLLYLATGQLIPVAP